jgi:hypothetical protein
MIDSLRLSYDKIDTNVDIIAMRFIREKMISLFLENIFNPCASISEWKIQRAK